MDEDDRRLAAELDAAWVANVRDLAERVAEYAWSVGVDDEALAASMESVARRLRVVADRRRRHPCDGCGNLVPADVTNCGGCGGPDEG